MTEQIKNLPDLAKAYLFQMSFTGIGDDEMAEALKLRAKSIETSPITKNQLVQFTVAFDEFQDFATLPFWYEKLADAGTVTEEEFESQSFTLDVNIYNGKMDKVIGKARFNSVNPVVIGPLVLNQEGDGKLQYKVTFMAKNCEVLKGE